MPEAHVEGAALGGYGMLWSLSSDDPNLVDSKRFGIMFNYGLSDEEFENGVYAFSTQYVQPVSEVPEPSTLALLCMGGACATVIAWRKKRRGAVDCSVC